MGPEEEKCFSLVNDVMYITRLDRHEYLSVLEEYFRYNIVSFNNPIREYSTVPTDYKDIFSRVCIIHLDNLNHPYFLQINRDTKKISYLLTDKIKNPFDMKEAVVFQIEFGKDGVFRKQSFNDKGFFIEVYKPGEYISTSIYDIDKVKDLVYSNRGIIQERDIMNSGILSFDDSIKIASVYIKQSSNNGNEFIIGGTDIISGQSLYSVYHDLMVKRGYFSGEEEKHGLLKI